MKPATVGALADTHTPRTNPKPLAGTAQITDGAESNARDGPSPIRDPVQWHSLEATQTMAPTDLQPDHLTSFEDTCLMQMAP